MLVRLNIDMGEVMNGVKNYLIYFICIGLLFLFLFFSVRIFEEKTNLANMKLYAMVNEYENTNIKNEELNIDINYPKFKYETLNKEVNNLIKQYDNIKDEQINNSININQNLITMYFTIN